MAAADGAACEPLHGPIGLQKVVAVPTHPASTISACPDHAHLSALALPKTLEASSQKAELRPRLEEIARLTKWLPRRHGQRIVAAHGLASRSVSPTPTMAISGTNRSIRTI